jgi:uncharacterized protein (TIGR02118 family)
MIKLTFCLRKLPGISGDEFRRVWLEEHGPLVRRHAEILCIRRYVQVHAVESDAVQAIRAARSTQETPYDGTAELWFDRIENLLETRETPAGRAAGQEIMEDEKRFIDLARSTMMFGEEHPFVE